ncbi:hypothetical protein UFOVP328_369 [uncultured Caudovirales phage]|uniref:Uncharacterized protein n=1 Tax=uncultured Caudovirales phage TaxID=2100421 RepID=A0A6J5LZ67_9CAUD|nr:hypothetical protein UFOVP328_369 [uncultured Caudovirales phage]
MTPVLIDSIEYLWYSVWGMIAGWGLTTTLFGIVIGILLIKYVNLNQRVQHLENRLISAERDYNLTLDKWLKK